MKLTDFIQAITTDPDFGDYVVHQRLIPGRPSSYGYTLELDPAMSQVASRLGINRLYSHQSEALEHVRNGKNVMVSTATASGKTLIYNLAVFEGLLKNRQNKSLYLFPLKALAQDQFKNLENWVREMRSTKISAEIYDGDTSAYRRRKIRSNIPDIILTNPDMLHRGILPYHENWEGLFKNLYYVVLDEVHTYRGIFGSHVTQIIRRLKRICKKHGSYPVFILLSATLTRPGHFGEMLLQEKLEVVESDGAPKAPRHFLLLNPEVSPNFLSAKLFAACIKRGFRTIAFTQSRKVTELLHIWASRLSPQLKGKISSYRAGFMPEERRKIEKRMAKGDLLGVISTSALEMGIDIGYLDVCILVGYPGTIINTWQRGGRVGRSGRESLIAIVAKPDALDQYFMKHPDDFFGRSYEAAVLDPDNPNVVQAHLPCAASEIPLTLEDQEFWQNEFNAHLEQLEKGNLLVRTEDNPPNWLSAKRDPQLKVDIRSCGENYTIFDKYTGGAIGTIDGIRAFKECHPGAVYLHRARQYVVESLAPDKRDIVAERADVQYFTRTRSEKETEIIEVLRSRPEGQFIVREGDLKVTETVTSYEKRALPGQELMGVFTLDLPPQTFSTVGFWIEIEPALKALVEKRGFHFMGGIHAIEHAMIGVFPLFALCDRNDIGGICYPMHTQVGKSAIFVYDAYPGGVGLAHRGFEIALELLEKAFNHVKSCECEDGCPSCIHSPKCGAGNKPLDKQAAILILKGLLGDIPLSEISTMDGNEGHAHKRPQKEGVGQEQGESRIIYLDLETQKTAQEVGGWQNCHLMRVSVAVLFDSAEKNFLIFHENDIDELFSRLKTADLIVGFNIRRFDYKVLGAYSSDDLMPLPTFDILADIYSRLGFRLGLDHLAKETLGRGKTADGLQAVEWFRHGEMEKLIEYCSNDVAATRDLFLYGIEHGHLVYLDKSSEKRLRLRVDWDLDNIVRSC